MRHKYLLRGGSIKYEEFTFEEFSDMHLIYGLAKGNASGAARFYADRDSQDVELLYGLIEGYLKLAITSVKFNTVIL